MYKNIKQLLLSNLIFTIIIFIFFVFVSFKTTTTLPIVLLFNAHIIVLSGFFFNFFATKKIDSFYFKIKIIFFNSIVFSFLFEILEITYSYFGYYYKTIEFVVLLKIFLDFWIFLFLLNFFGGIMLIAWRESVLILLKKLKT